MKRLVAVTAVWALLLAGCANGESGPAADPLLARYGLAGKSAVEIIDHLDRLGGDDRPAALKASVRPHTLELSGDGQKVTLDIPADRFYLSVAPYVNRTHECFYHSLTTCKGELAATDLAIRIVDDSNGAVLVDLTGTTFANGFVGFWLPRDVKATLTVTVDGRTATTAITTGQDAPTCLTTLKLA